MIHLMGRSMLLAVSAYMLTACTTGTNLYYWGNYEQALYSYTKRPGEVDQYIESLGEIVAEGEKRNKVPPGLYAEYGYALMTAGREAEALEYFEKERTKWPEANTLMGLMIDGNGFSVDRDNAADTGETVSE